jgi:hypothetical protein
LWKKQNKNKKKKKKKKEKKFHKCFLVESLSTELWQWKKEDSEVGVQEDRRKRRRSWSGRRSRARRRF